MPSPDIISRRPHLRMKSSSSNNRGTPEITDPPHRRDLMGRAPPVDGAFIGAGQGPANQPVRIVVPYTAGGPADVLARALGEQLSSKWGQPVIIDNRPVPTRSSPRRKLRVHRPMAPPSHRLRCGVQPDSATGIQSGHTSLRTSCRYRAWSPPTSCWWREVRVAGQQRARARRAFQTQPEMRTTGRRRRRQSPGDGLVQHINNLEMVHVP